jgi:hypothetical protein
MDCILFHVKFEVVLFISVLRNKETTDKMLEMRIETFLKKSKLFTLRRRDKRVFWQTIMRA